MLHSATAFDFAEQLGQCNCTEGMLDMCQLPIQSMAFMGHAPMHAIAPSRYEIRDFDMHFISTLVEPQVS